MKLLTPDRHPDPEDEELEKEEREKKEVPPEPKPFYDDWADTDFINTSKPENTLTKTSSEKPQKESKIITETFEKFGLKNFASENTLGDGSEAPDIGKFIM